MKIILLSLMIFMTIGVTVAHKLLETLGLDTNYILIALTALIITQFVLNRSKTIISLVIIVTILILLEPLFLINLGISREILLMSLVALVVTPDIYKLLH